ncbi:hypothetical protein B0J11DRAFT_522666 [Dendryphion nanum]|uniref:Uncharacterized protein n=1 Tax=Dendryphion nanum TaxID=256645 RepID=A0A9P9E1F3_9PLEO|nr:hypothetical protein B0J11DRAFT_522666 [Dendryphion nanum]
MKDNKNEVPQIASAEHISAFIQKLHSEERDGIAGQNSTSTTPPGTPPPAVRKTPWRNNTFDKPTLVSREDTQAKPNLGLVEARVRPLPSTPVNKSKAMDRDEAATRTPSKEIESSLDRAIDRQIVLDMKKGHEFTPGGNRISDLLKRRKEWLGLEGYEADE